MLSVFRLLSIDSLQSNMQKHINPSQPKISVVIPAYNEEKLLGKTLESVLAQDYHDFELIIADNNSTDQTGEVAQSYGAIVVVAKEKGVAHARQKGFEAAKGEIIVSTDGDTMVPPNWLSSIMTAFEKDPKLVAYGGVGILYSGTMGSIRASKYLYYPFRIFDELLSGGWNLMGSNMAIKKSAFQKVGGFATDLAMEEDNDLSRKLRKIGKVTLDPHLVVMVSGRKFQKGLWRGIQPYVVSTFQRLFLRKTKFTKFPDVR